MFKSYVSSLKKEFKGYNSQKLIKDVLAGLTVAAVALPLALAFGVSSGADAGAGTAAGTNLSQTGALISVGSATRYLFCLMLLICSRVYFSLSKPNIAA